MSPLASPESVPDPDPRNMKTNSKRVLTPPRRPRRLLTRSAHWRVRGRWRLEKSSNNYEHGYYGCIAAACSKALQDQERAALAPRPPPPPPTTLQRQRARGAPFIGLGPRRPALGVSPREATGPRSARPMEPRVARPGRAGGPGEGAGPLRDQPRREDCRALAGRSRLEQEEPVPRAGARPPCTLWPEGGCGGRPSVAETLLLNDGRPTHSSPQHRRSNPLCSGRTSAAQLRASAACRC